MFCLKSASHTCRPSWHSRFFVILIAAAVLCSTPLEGRAASPVSSQSLTSPAAGSVSLPHPASSVAAAFSSQNPAGPSLATVPHSSQNPASPASPAAVLGAFGLFTLTTPPNTANPDAPQIIIEQQETGILVKFDKGKGILNGNPMFQETLISAPGSYQVYVSDEYGNENSAVFAIKPALPVNINPLLAYTPARCAADIEMLQQQYPGLIRSGTIGQSSFGTAIPYITLGTGKRSILLVGSVHAREHLTTTYLMKLVETYAAAYSANQRIDGYDVKAILNETTLTVVPMLNPDGVSFVVEGYQSLSQAAIESAFGRIADSTRRTWKETMTGVNLNRNFPFYWNEKDITSQGFLKQIMGPSAASEPETKALMHFCQTNPFAFALAFHAKGEILYWRDKKNGVVSGDELLTNAIAKNTGYRIAGITTNEALYGGGFENWFRYAFQRPAICIELTPHNGSAIPHSNANFHKLIWEKADSLGLAAASVRMP